MTVQKFLIFVIIVLAIVIISRLAPSKKLEVKEGVNPSEIVEVLPKDAIPAIDEPKFESVTAADTWLNDNDLVFGLEIDGTFKAFPQKILNWHEIVNNPEGIIVTFCPLCGSAVAYEGEGTTFGVSGKLYNSDLIMYDRESETLWSQITGEAIAGAKVGEKLKKVSIQTLSWGEWKKLYPDSLVLSKETGFSRDYDLYPYGDYEVSERINFPVATRDSRLQEKEVVWGVSINGAAKAYPEGKLKDQKAKFKDRLGQVEVEILFENGEMKVKRTDTQETVVPVRNFWFAWVAFFPQTELY